MISLSSFTNTLLINEMKFKSADLINNCVFIKESTAELISNHFNKNNFINSSVSYNGIIFEFKGFTDDHKIIEAYIYENSLNNMINLKINSTSEKGTKNTKILEFRQKQLKQEVSNILENYEKENK